MHLKTPKLKDVLAPTSTNGSVLPEAPRRELKAPPHIARPVTKLPPGVVSGGVLGRNKPKTCVTCACYIGHACHVEALIDLVTGLPVGRDAGWQRSTGSCGTEGRRWQESEI